MDRTNLMTYVIFTDFVISDESKYNTIRFSIFPQKAHRPLTVVKWGKTLPQPASQVTFNFGNKYRQMESSDVVKNFWGSSTGCNMDHPR